MACGIQARTPGASSVSKPLSPVACVLSVAFSVSHFKKENTRTNSFIHKNKVVFAEKKSDFFIDAAVVKEEEEKEMIEHGEQLQHFQWPRLL